ncbi:hybrid sensor histidine kinase/response regulator [Rhodoferax koreense]|uniref:histidine kinase n=1 Tax=Rhodoferax koreensis TaxID=1842727 RepID=A0A1P8K3S7_9BURK|nr:hybrid sensor histidine kinase/response regulator [Rhodoferax koreense]APW40659.1 hybrid sensor histidine kinase/response regulator [Rhodoferax koreense]
MGDRNVHGGGDQPVPGPRVKCLLVDDLQENLLALSALLRRDDVELLLARSGMEALELLLKHDVALALLDVQMPEMDGFELAELMRGSERTRHVPIIFVTAGARDQQRLFKGYDSGAVDFLFKPIEAHILKSKAEVFFQLYRQKRQLAQNLAERTETLRLHEMFTAVLGHDLRGPLSAMMMAAQVLTRRPEEPVQKVGARLIKSGHWMARMIEDVLDVSRARLAGGIPVKRQHFDLGQLVERIAGDYRTLFPDHAITVSLLGDLSGHLDEDRWVQVVSNLVGNALHHGQPEDPVEVRADGRSADAIFLSVANGGAIPPEVLPSIFDPFRRGGRTSSRAEGLGLGLYIVQQIVRSHGGTVDVATPDGKTVFTVTVPRG